MPQTSTDLLSTAKAAEHARVSVSTIARWVREGRLEPAIRVEGLRGAMFFRRADLAALVEPEAGPTYDDVVMILILAPKT